MRTTAEPRPAPRPRGVRGAVVTWDAADVASWHRAAETLAVIGAVALCVVVAGPGGALEHLFVPLFGSIDDPMERLTELAFGIPLAVLLVPGLGLWAWGPRLRPAGTALTVLATLAVTVDLAVAGRLTMLAWMLLATLWILAIYQVLTVRLLDAGARRPLVLVLAGAASALPWFVQAARMLVEQTRAGEVLQADYIIVMVMALAIGVLLALPLVRLVSFAPAGVAAAVAAVVYALMSLVWTGPGIALPRASAVLAVAAAIAYVDTVRNMASRSPRSHDAGRETDAGTPSDQPG